MANTGKNISELAGEHGNTPQAWYDCIKGRTKSQALRGLISGYAKIPESELWPEIRVFPTKEAA